MQAEANSINFSTILASSIHDMKNSLSMFLNKIDQLSLDHETNHQLDQLKYEGKRVNDHLIQLLVLYRLNKTQYFANIDEIDISDFFDEVLSEHIALLAEHNIELQLELEDDLYWYIDRDLIASVITNIMNNLYIYTRSKIAISAKEKGGQLVIAIQDDGPGYPSDMLLSIDHDKQNIDVTSGSTGLGLYFASTAASLHKNKGKEGYITISNDGIENGGCFTIVIP